MSKVLVTGGTKGIGGAIAHRLRESGHDVLTCARGEGADLRCDVTDAAQVARMRDAAGEIYVLVNNVGGAISKPFLQLTEQDLDDQLRMNLKSAWYCIHAFLPGMLERGSGRIINIASTAGKIGYKYVSAYVASKHALVGLTRALAAEVASRGVTVNAICPSFVDTPMLRDSAAEVSARSGKPVDQLLGAMLSRNPQGRFVEPEEVAAAVLFLIETAAVNGQTLTLCGGETFG